MFSRVIGFFEILFGLWKIVLIYGILVLLTYNTGLFITKQVDIDAYYVILLLPFVVFLSPMNSVLLSILFFQLLSGKALGGELENVIVNPSYQFLVYVSVILFLILGFNFIKYFVGVIRELVKTIELSGYDRHTLGGIPTLLKIVLYLANFAIIVVLLGSEIWFIVEPSRFIDMY